jgi:hypothetical protein
MASAWPCPLLLAGLVCSGPAAAQIPEQYPKPLIHTQTNHPAARVLLLSIDGLHAIDLANYVASHPHSALAELTARGVTYTNARTPVSDPLAGLAAAVTGGTPISTGIISLHGYGMVPQGRDDPRLGLQVNTIFEVVHQKIGPTAWAGESLQTDDLLRGPSREGVDELCPLDTSVHGDTMRVAELIRLIDGRSCIGDGARSVPALFGMSFTAIAAAQRTFGYLDALATPSAGLAQALDSTDVAIGRLIAELKSQRLYETTWIALVSPFGQSPIDSRQHRILPTSRIEAVVNAASPNSIAHIADGGSVMLWLKDHATTSRVAKALSDHARELGIEAIRSGNDLALTLNMPARDPRMPDIFLQPQPGLRWTVAGDKDIAGSGGTLDDDTHVALLIAGAQLTGRSDPTLVPTTQLAPLLLRALGMEKFDLDALHREHTPALPGIF